jgi:lipopolysaccharide biosynthesis regulator YciM
MIIDLDEELRQQIEDHAVKIYKQIKAEDPDYWHEVISYISLFALRDRYHYNPAGLTSEGRAFLSEAMKRRKHK